ncbi:MAG: sodium:solute symporter [Prevotella sp.]|jgi:SSS family transporter|nr:sodium:solute symporter [Prevotella sp.]
MSAIILIIIAVYFVGLYLISVVVSRKKSDNDAFFTGNRQSPWWVVAIAMVGTSISGVTFVSVPGWVRETDMTYMQMAIGFFFGYIAVAYVLLPLYYRLNLITIYGYLEQRFGKYTYKTGALFFILSKLTGAAARLYLVAMLLQSLAFARWSIPFPATVAGIILLIWLYTRRSGIKTVIWTDMLQTICFITALILIIWQVASQLNLDFSGVADTVRHSEHFRLFVFDDWSSRQHFVKQFFSGIFIVIVMTGLDQDMMQKNLTCKTLKESRKNMLVYGSLFAPVNFLFLSLGILLLAFAAQQQIALPASSDEILPLLAENYLGFPVLVFFTLGITAAAFSSADSALTALTTTFCVDLLNIKRNEAATARNTRLKVHAGISIVFGAIIVLLNYLGQTSLIDAIYVIASYTYGPLLGLFALGLFTNVRINDKYVPAVCILSPFLCYAASWYLAQKYGYQMGYEALMLNALITVIGLLATRKKAKC